VAMATAEDAVTLRLVQQQLIFMQGKCLRELFRQLHKCW